MKFFRFSNNDENYSLQNRVRHFWDLPLRLDHKKVGLSSLHVQLVPGISNPEPLLILKCNLVDRTMCNPQGILHEIPIGTENYVNYYVNKPTQIGKNILCKQMYIKYLF